MWVNESVAEWFHDSDCLFTYFWMAAQAKLEFVFIMAGVKNSPETSLIVQQEEEISLLLQSWNHWEALIVADVKVSQWPLSIQDFHVPLEVVCVAYDVLLCESKLSE